MTIRANRHTAALKIGRGDRLILLCRPVGHKQPVSMTANEATAICTPGQLFQDHNVFFIRVSCWEIRFILPNIFIHLSFDDQLCAA